MEKRACSSTFLPDEFLAKIVAELDEDKVTAIILHGSYVRGEAVPPYSDIDLVRITQENLLSGSYEEKQFLYREGYLLSVSSRPLSVYRQRFIQPERAIFAIPGVREACILLDKQGEFHKFQQEAWQWTWEPLQTAADAYASQLLVEQTEIALKLLRALALHDSLALSEMITELFVAVTDAVAVQRGVLVRSGNTYFHQVQEAVGQQSDWVRYHTCIAGAGTHALSLREQGQQMLHLYQETAQLLRKAINPGHWDVIKQTLSTLKQHLSDEEIS